MTVHDYWYVEGFRDGYNESKTELLALLAKRRRELPFSRYPNADAWVIIMLAWLGVDCDLQPIDPSETIHATAIDPAETTVNTSPIVHTGTMADT